MPPYQLILFDFDGTLCHSELADLHALQKAYQSLAQPVPSMYTIRSAMKTGAIASDLLKQLSPVASPIFIEKLLKNYKTFYPVEAASATLFPGVTSVLKQLKAANINMAIVSNKDADLLPAAASSLQISEYFRAVIGAGEGKPCKPNPTLYKNTIIPQFPNIPPHATLMVGDTDTDIRFASNVSMDACWASYGGGDREKCQRLQPKYTIEAVSELLDIIGLARTTV